MMKHSWFEKRKEKSVNNLLNQQAPAACPPACVQTLDFFFYNSISSHQSLSTLLQLRSWSLIVTFSPCTGAGYESHSGILHATYAALCRSRPYNNINNLRVYPKPCFPSVPNGSRPFPQPASPSDPVPPLGEWIVHHRFPFEPHCRYFQSGSARLSVYPPNDFP